MQAVSENQIFDWRPEPLVRDNERQVLIFTRGDLMFVFNFNPEKSFPDYKFDAPSGKFTYILDTDDKAFDGLGRIDRKTEHFTRYVSPGRGQLSLYIPARTGLVLRRS